MNGMKGGHQCQVTFVIAGQTNPPHFTNLVAAFRKLLDSYSSGVGSPEVKECPSVPILCKSWGVEQRGVEKFARLATQKGIDESSYYLCFDVRDTR